MKYILSSLLTTLTVGILAFSSATYASTPDGQTPANEGVCDGLKGGTPGLYGLCVAFCEAQDHAALSAPITQGELEALEDGVPSGRILENYNKKKQDGDPDMPCIKVEEPCPCWDSVDFDRATNSGIGTLYCNTSDGPVISGASIQDYKDAFNQTLVFAADVAGDEGYPICVFGFAQNGSSSISNSLKISHEQFIQCNAQIRQRQEDLGISGSCYQGL